MSSFTNDETRWDVICDLMEMMPEEDGYDETDWEREYHYVQQMWKVEDDGDIEEETEEDDGRCCRVNQFGERCDERVSGVAGCMGGEYCSRCFEIEVGMYNEDEYY